MVLGCSNKTSFDKSFVLNRLTRLTVFELFFWGEQRLSLHEGAFRGPPPVV